MASFVDINRTLSHSSNINRTFSHVSHPTTKETQVGGGILAKLDEMEKVESANTLTAPVEEEDTRVYPDISTVRSILLVTMVMLSTVMQVASGMGVSITITEIGRDLDIAAGQLQWIGTAGSLATACTLLISGRLSDMYGHKPVFLIGNGIGGAMFLAQGLAKTKYEFFIFRALGGVAFSAVGPANIGLIGSTFDEGPIKSRAFAALGAAAPIGAAIGLVLGGITTQYTATGWRTYFYISGGISALVVGTGVVVVPGSWKLKAQDSRYGLASLDWLGMFLSAAAMCCIIFPLGYGEGAPEGWRTPWIGAMLGVGFVLAGVFVAWQWYIENKLKRQPLMKLGIWRKKNFATLMGVVLCLSGAFGAVIFWMTLYWQNFEQRTVIETTIRFIPICIFGVLANILGSFIVARFTGQMMLLAGCFATAVSAILFAACPAHYIYWAFQFPAACLVVWGADFMYLTCMLYMSATVRMDEQAQAGGIFNAITQIGNGVVVAITTLVSDKVANRKSAQLGMDVNSANTVSSAIPPLALLEGYRAAFWTCTGFMALAIIAILVGLRGLKAVGKKAKAKETVEEEAIPELEKV